MKASAIGPRIGVVQQESSSSSQGKASAASSPQGASAERGEKKRRRRRIFFMLKGGVEHKDRKQTMFFHERTCFLFIKPFIVIFCSKARSANPSEIPPELETRRDRSCCGVAFVKKTPRCPCEKSVHREGSKGCFFLSNIPIASSW